MNIGSVLALSGTTSITGGNKNNLNTDISVDNVFNNYLKGIAGEDNEVKKVGGITGFTEAIKTMNGEQVQATNLMTDVLTGKSEDTQGALVALEKATTKMDLAVKIRDEAIQAYEKLVNIQI